MDQCEDTEEGAPPSKTTLWGQHESQTNAQSSEVETSIKEQLLEMLDDLGEQELERFHWYLQNIPVGRSPTIKKSRLENASRTRTVDVMVETYSGGRVMEVARSVLKKTNGGKPSAQGASSASSGGGPQIIRMVLLGKSGVGKSASGNTILGRRAFRSFHSCASVTSECQKETGEFEGQRVAVVNTPGLFHTHKSQQEVMREITRCMIFAAPGPHVFLLVNPAGRVRHEEQETVKILQKMFGEEAAHYTVALFTQGDDLKPDGNTIERYISDVPALCHLIHQCHGRFHVLNNTSRDPSQVRELLEKISTMIQRNGGSYYTYEMFQKAERARREEIERLH